MYACIINPCVLSSFRGTTGTDHLPYTTILIYSPHSYQFFSSISYLIYYILLLLITRFIIFNLTLAGVGMTYIGFL